MADLQEQLQSILGNPEAMSQITAIARALTGGPAPEDAPSPEPPIEDVKFTLHDMENSGTSDPLKFSESDDFKGPDSSKSEAPPDLGALLGMLGGPDLDPRLIQIALGVFSEYSAQDDEKVALLSALKPFLRAERREKMEKAEKIARLSRVVRVAIRLLKEEGTGYV